MASDESGFSALQLCSASWLERCLSKHTRHKTGLPCLGLKGTLVCAPHSEQVTANSTSTLPLPRPCARRALQRLQRRGSLTKCLNWKNSCSPAEKTNSSPHSTHFKVRSVNAIQDLPFPQTRKSSPACHPRTSEEFSSTKGAGAYPGLGQQVPRGTHTRPYGGIMPISRLCRLSRRAVMNPGRVVEIHRNRMTEHFREHLSLRAAPTGLRPVFGMLSQR